MSNNNIDIITKIIAENCSKVDEQGRNYCSVFACPSCKAMGQCRSYDGVCCVNEENGACVLKNYNCLACGYVGSCKCIPDETCDGNA